MRLRTWPVAGLGLGGLLPLVIVSVLAASNRAEAIYTQLDRLNSHHRDVEAKLRTLRSDVHLSIHLPLPSRPAEVFRARAAG
jgi:hypothetical protein